MSDPTIWHYIVPDIKKEILIYYNPLWTFSVLWAVQTPYVLTNAFLVNSSLTISCIDLVENTVLKC